MEKLKTRSRYGSMEALFKHLLLGCLGMLLLAPAQAGGGWPQLKAEGYFKLSQWWLTADQHYTDAGLIDPNITTGIFNTSLYAEYGFTNRLTGVLYMPFFSRAFNNNQVSGTTGEILTPGDAINSFGDTDIGIKYGLTKPGSAIAVSATLTLGIPLGVEIGGSQNNLQTGDGEFNQLLKIDAGKSFGKAYGNIYAGYNNRSKGFSDEVHYGVEAGVQLLNRKFWLIGRVFGVSSMRNGDNTIGTNSTSIFANNIEYTSASLEAAFYLRKHMGISGTVANAFRGELILARPSYAAGIFFELK